jgi:hypothetical protein
MDGEVMLIAMDAGKVEVDCGMELSGSGTKMEWVSGGCEASEGGMRD